MPDGILQQDMRIQRKRPSDYRVLICTKTLQARYRNFVDFKDLNEDDDDDDDDGGDDDECDQRNYNQP
ncbi:hypothetical protein M0802_003692 [Mischocyttarus mexicanus]|nr:hypothetical protein M0802_003692 [Mischocyttarus mexicanus]